MAMNFMGANRAEMPDYTDAYVKQALIAQQLRQAEQQRRMMYGEAGASLAERVPKEKWATLGKQLMGGEAMTTTAANVAPATMGEAAMGSSLVEPITGAVASGVPEAAAASELLGTTGAMSAAPAAALGAEAAGTAGAAMAGEAALAAEAGAAAAGAAGTGGVSGALMALGPAGWAALLGLGLMATDAL